MMLSTKEVYWSQGNNSEGLSYVPGVDLQKKKMRPGFQKRQDSKLKKPTKQHACISTTANPKPHNEDSTKDKEKRGKSRASSSPKAFRVSLKDLCPEDKLRVANLIRELAKAGEEKEASENKLVKERHKFGVQLDELKADKERIEQEQHDILAQFKECQKLLVFYQKQIAEEQNQVTRDINRLLTETPLNRTPRECCEKKVQMPDELDQDVAVREDDDFVTSKQCEDNIRNKDSYFDSSGRLGESYRASENYPTTEQDQRYTTASQLSNYLPAKSPSHVERTSTHPPKVTKELRQNRVGNTMNYYSDGAEVYYDRGNAGNLRNTKKTDGTRGTTSTFEQRSQDVSPEGKRMALMIQKRQLETEQAQLQQMLTEQEDILRFRQTELKKRHEDYLKRMTHFQKYGEVPASSDNAANNTLNTDDPQVLKNKLSRISSGSQRASSKPSDPEPEIPLDQRDEVNKSNFRQILSKTRPYSEHAIRQKPCAGCKWVNNQANDSAGTELASLRNTLDELTLRSQLLSAAASNLIDSSDADVSFVPSRDRSSASYISQTRLGCRDSDTTDERRSAYTTGLTSDPSSDRCLKPDRSRPIKRTQSADRKTTKRLYPSDAFPDQMDINPLEREVSSALFSTPSRRLRSTMNNLDSLHALTSDLDNLASRTNGSFTRSNLMNSNPSQVNPANIQSSKVLRDTNSRFVDSSTFQGRPSSFQQSAFGGYNLNDSDYQVPFQDGSSNLQYSRTGQNQSTFEDPGMYQGRPFASRNTTASVGQNNSDRMSTPYGQVRENYSNFVNSDAIPGRPTVLQNTRWERDNHSLNRSVYDDSRPTRADAINRSQFQDRPLDFQSSRSNRNEQSYEGCVDYLERPSTFRNTRVNDYNDSSFEDQNDKRYTYQPPRYSRMNQTSFEDSNQYQDLMTGRQSSKMFRNKQSSFEDPYMDDMPPAPPNSRYNSENRMTDDSGRNVTFDPEDSELLEDIFFIK